MKPMHSPIIAHLVDPCAPAERIDRKPGRPGTRRRSAADKPRPFRAWVLVHEGTVRAVSSPDQRHGTVVEVRAETLEALAEVLALLPDGPRVLAARAASEVR